MRIIQSLMNILFLFILSASCSSNADREEGGEVPYKTCEHDGEYADSTEMAGEAAYLFIDSVPSRLQNKSSVLYIIHHKKDDLTTFSASYPDASYTGNICNFPEFAKAWEVSDEGRLISYKGTFYEAGRYLSVPPLIGGNMILTILK